jgi:hypothetical protein
MSLMNLLTILREFNSVIKIIRINSSSRLREIIIMDKNIMKKKKIKIIIKMNNKIIIKRKKKNKINTFNRLMNKIMKMKNTPKNPLIKINNSIKTIHNNKIQIIDFLYNNPMIQKLYKTIINNSLPIKINSIDPVALNPI